MIPIRWMNRTTNDLIWWADSRNAWEPSVSIGPQGWVQRWVREGGDDAHDPTHTVTLAEARERARNGRKLRLDGVDPIE
ncbi:MAG: hypothetical protein ACREE3_12455, partial [Stellaceae bacterium]